MFCVCFLVRHIFCDVILLRNNLNASCFPEEDNLVAYLAPPNVQPKRDNDFVDDVVVENDDWVPASTNESITDSRWRGNLRDKFKNIVIHNLKKSANKSVKNTHNLHFFYIMSIRVLDYLFVSLSSKSGTFVVKSASLVALPSDFVINALCM